METPMVVVALRQRVELLSRDVLTLASGNNASIGEDGEVKSVTSSWPLTRLDTALALATGYLLFVFLGSAIMKTFKSLNFTSFIKFAQMIYNPAQVILCIYMIGEVST